VKQPIVDEMNTIEGIELYKPLYEICSLLYYATQNHTLECLNYYTDTERDADTGIEHVVFYAEIKDTWDLSMKERYNAHKKLLQRVMSNDTTLIYSNKTKNIDEEMLQIPLF
jgi:hypothetical protein